MPFNSKVKRCCLCSTDKKQKFTTLCGECKRIQQYIRDYGILNILNFINRETTTASNPEAEARCRAFVLPTAPPQYH